MIVALDHVVILVHDLEAATRSYGALGFTVTPGGTHADGATHNALVAFEDGSYIELIAFLKNTPGHFFHRAENVTGLITYALLPGDIGADIDAARSRGLEITGPVPGGRLRPDGTEISWQLGRAAKGDMPFLCADVTPRELRVPGGSATVHDNGASGVMSITVTVGDIEASTRRYASLLGMEPDLYFTQHEPDAHVAAFHVGNASIALIQPVGGAGPMRDYIETRGDGPYTLALRTLKAASAGDLDIAKAQNARITLVHTVA